MRTGRLLSNRISNRIGHQY